MWCIINRNSRKVIERFPTKALALHYARNYDRGVVYVEWRASYE